MTQFRSRCPLLRRSRRAAAATLPALALSLVLLGGTASASSAVVHFTPASAKANIIADWKTFFSSKTPASRKIQLVQDGSAFAKVIKQQAGEPMAQGVGATVSKVTLNKAMTKAAVVYTITIQKAPVLTNQQGTAIYQGGTWKVGAQSFCALLALEGSAKQVSVCNSKSK